MLCNIRKIIAYCYHLVSVIDAHKGVGGGRGGKVKKISHKNAIKHKKWEKKGTPLDFLITPSSS
jgi:hypothetical protein